MNPHDGDAAPATDTSTDTSTDDALVPPVDPLDLDRIGSDLDGVEAALRRLDDGTYWTDEVTGEPLSDDLLAADPVARRNEA